MQHVMGADEPRPVEIYEDMGTGRRCARIRRNITDDWHDVPQDSEEEPTHFWEWDETVLETELDAEEIEANADELWEVAEQQQYDKQRREMTDQEWRADVDAAILDLMEMAVGE